MEQLRFTGFQDSYAATNDSSGRLSGSTMIVRDGQRHLKLARFMLDGGTGRVDKEVDFYDVDRGKYHCDRPVVGYENESNGGRADRNPAEMFLRLVGKFAFRDVGLIKVVQELSRRRLPDLTPKLFVALEAFIQGKLIKPTESGRLDEIELNVDMFSELVNFLAIFRKMLEELRSVLGRHEFFADVDLFIEQIDLVQGIVRDSKMNLDDRAPRAGLFISLPPIFEKFFPDVTEPVRTDTINPFEAKSKLLAKLGLTKCLEYFLAVAMFIKYADRVNSEDKNIQGLSFPGFVEGGDGLILDVEGFAHPQLEVAKPDGYFSQQGWPVNERSFHRSSAQRFLSQSGLIVCKDVRGGDPDYSWKRGLKRKDLDSVLAESKLTDAEKLRIIKCFEANVFRRFSKVRIDEKTPVHTLTGANAKGKTIMMKSLADVVYMAMCGRRVHADRASLNFCDGIFHDFDVKDDLNNGISKLRAQIRKVVEFIDKGTTYSLGLFDELYHGTSSPYLLSLALATIEFFVKHRRRAIVATHEPLLPSALHPEGYGLLRGRYAIPTGSSDFVDASGVGALCVGGDYELGRGIVMDSDAFPVAESEGLPTEIISRAREVLDHIRTPAA